MKFQLDKLMPSYRLLLSICLLLLVPKTVVAQFDIPPKPEITAQSSLYDYINLLSPAQQNALKTKLITYADSTSTQIVIAIISSANGDDLSLVGAKWGQKWGIGQADEDNGILILLAKDDKQIDINTGYGIEYRLSDRMAERVINRVIIPEFKTGNFYSGLDKGTDAIFEILKGEFNEDRDFTKNNNETPSKLILLVIIIFIIIFLSTKKKGPKGGNGGNKKEASLFDFIILSNMGRRTGGFGGSSGNGSFGGGFGGGGFGGGFGGGGFGGGGASGSW